MEFFKVDKACPRACRQKRLERDRRFIKLEVKEGARIYFEFSRNRDRLDP